MTTFLYRTIEREEKPIDRIGFGELLNPTRIAVKCSSFGEFQNFLQIPIVAFARLVIRFLVKISSFGLPRAECNNDVEDDDAPRNRTCLRQVIAVSRWEVWEIALKMALSLLGNAFIMARISFAAEDIAGGLRISVFAKHNNPPPITFWRIMK